MRWEVMYTYIRARGKIPRYYEARTQEELECQIRNSRYSSHRLRRPIGDLEFDVMTDQVDVWFNRDGIRHRYMILMAGD